MTVQIIEFFEYIIQKLLSQNLMILSNIHSSVHFQIFLLQSIFINSVIILFCISCLYFSFNFLIISIAFKYVEIKFELLLNFSSSFFLSYIFNN